MSDPVNKPLGSVLLILTTGDFAEYFCKSCGQLRLDLREGVNTCGNCKSADIVKGEPGTLDKEALRKEQKL